MPKGMCEICGKKYHGWSLDNKTYYCEKCGGEILILSESYWTVNKVYAKKKLRVSGDPIEITENNILECLKDAGKLANLVRRREFESEKV